MPESHTATQEWQSFEMRMRRRRAERCALRASAALDAGVLDEARAAIDEAAQLDPYNESINELAGRITAAERAPADLPLQSMPSVETADDAAATKGSRTRWVVMAALILMASAVGGWSWEWMMSGRDPAAAPERRADAAPSGVPSSDTAAAAAQPVPDPPAEAVTIRTELATAATSGADSTSPASAATPEGTTGGGAPAPAAPTASPNARPAVEPEPIVVAERRPPVNAAAPAVSSGAPRVAADPTPVAPAPSTAPPAPAPPAPDPPAVSLPDSRPPAALLSELPAADANVARTPVPAPMPARESTPSAPAPDTVVRSVLGRYEAAYSRLDAAAAGAVWPSVDRRALARAFDGLESQQISLGQCNVTVAGASAQAECRGTARWTPKVGGGAQSASRGWRFELRNQGGEWVIVSANARNLDR